MVEQDRPAITVGATGVAGARPDLVYLGLGVQTRADTPGQALNQAVAAAEVLVRLVEQRGVRAENRQTAGVAVNAVFDHNRQVVSHHQASYRLTVKLTDIDAAGALLDDAAGENDLAGVLQVESIAFSFVDPEPLLSAARARAVASARHRAEELAAAAGVGLGPVRTIVETDRGFPQPAAMDGMRHRAQAASVEPGTQDLVVQVSITFDIAG